MSTAPATRLSRPTTPRPGVALGPVGVRVRTRTAVAAVTVVVALLALVGLALTTGTYDLPADRLLPVLTGRGTRLENLVVLDNRLARTLAAALVGAALGLAGALTQSVTRNPIASPDILGVTAGAGALAVLAVTRPALFDAVPLPAPVLLPLCALVGGLVTTALVLVLSWRGGFDSLRLVLVGLAVNAIALAATSYLLTRASLEEAAAATRWLTGSLADAEVGDVAVLRWVVPACLLGCVVVAPGVAAVRMGREVAPVLGVRVGRVEATSLALAVVAVAAATAVAGPVGFVAFVAPQLAMRLFGTPGPPAVAGALVGALLTLAADLAVQRVTPELPVGVATAVVGAPYLLWVLTRGVRGRRG